MLEEKDLTQQEREDVSLKTKKNGVTMRVRNNRHRYFFPEEWDILYNNVRDINKFIFDLLIISGARIEEALCLKRNNINIEQNYFTLYVTKIKAKKKETKPAPRNITFNLAFKKKLNKYINDNNIGEYDYLFLDNSKTYNDIKDIKKEAKKKKSAVYQLFKRALERSSIQDPWNFSLHNIRKTHGMWLKAMNVKAEEICLRLGHDYNTYLKHYGSADIFRNNQRIAIQNKFKGILGI